jgi:hypothetical protein
MDYLKIINNTIQYNTIQYWNRAERITTDEV